MHVEVRNLVFFFIYIIIVTYSTAFLDSWDFFFSIYTFKMIKFVILDYYFQHGTKVYYFIILDSKNKYIT